MCGCSGRRSAAPRFNARPVVGPKAIVGGAAAGINPAQARVLKLQNNVVLGNTKRMDEQRLAAERARRAAIQKRLG